MKKAMIFPSIFAALAVMACSTPPSDPAGPVEPQSPAVPEGLVVDGSLSETSFGVRWDAVPAAVSYEWKLLEGMTLKSDGTVSSPAVAFSGLSPATLYRVAVRSVGERGSSRYSPYLEVTTLKESPDLPVPSPLKDVYGAMKMPSREDGAGALAFPGAEGCGRVATGGRGGSVLHVTSLKDDGSEGTLRWAVGQSGARTIVFDVAGMIDLTSQLVIRRGDVTIAGQTAPGDGICLRNRNVRIAADNVIIRYLRFRMGDASDSEDDALNAYTSDATGHSRIIIDHCSMSWSTDECASFYGVKDFTLQWCIMSESLRNSVHEKGKHGYCGLWGGADASYHHNLLAHHDSRNPRFDHAYLNGTVNGPVHFYNNVIYNWGSNSGYGGESGPGDAQRRINMVANYYKPGPASSHRTRIVNPTTKCDKCNPSDQYDVTPGLFYVEGNFMEGSEDVTSDNWKGVEPDDKSLLEKVKSASYLGVRPEFIDKAEDAKGAVLAKAGASVKRDAVDLRIVDDAAKGTFRYPGSRGSSNGLIDSQNDVGGWPEYSATALQALIAGTDSDSDGIPDYYEDLFGLNKKDPSDAAVKTVDKLGRYSNFEMYLHYLTIN